MEIDVLRPQFMPADMVEQWRAIQAAAGPAVGTPFLSPYWGRAVERAQDGVDKGLRVAVLHEGGRPRGFMGVRAGSFTAMAPGAPMCDYQGLVAEPGVTLDPRRLVQALGVGRFDFSHMIAEQAPFAPYARGRDVSWVVDLKDGYAAYAAAKKAEGSVIKELERKRRKAEREAGEITFTAFSRSRADFDQMIAWKRAQFASTHQTDVLATGWTQALLRDLFAMRDPDFGGALFTLHIADRLAAVQFHLRGMGVIHAWQIAQDQAGELDKYSPGLLLFHELLRWMDQTPYRRLDLGAGDYRFKRELANTTQGVTYGFVGVPSPAALVRQAAYGVRQVVETLPVGAVRELPGKAMRRLDILRGLR